MSIVSVSRWAGPPQDGQSTFTQSVAEVALVRFAQLAKDDDWTGIRAFWDEVLGAMYAIGIPVTGIDLLVPDVTGEEYVFIEANERPGLANHEPQPTAAAFVDFLFPGRPGLPQAWTPEQPPL